MFAFGQSEIRCVRRSRRRGWHVALTAGHACRPAQARRRLGDGAEGLRGTLLSLLPFFIVFVCILSSFFFSFLFSRVCFSLRLFPFYFFLLSFLLSFSFLCFYVFASFIYSSFPFFRFLSRSSFIIISPLFPFLCVSSFHAHTRARIYRDVFFVLLSCAHLSVITSVRCATL